MLLPSCLYLQGGTQYHLFWGDNVLLGGISRLHFFQKDPFRSQTERFPSPLWRAGSVRSSDPNRDNRRWCGLNSVLGCIDPALPFCRHWPLGQWFVVWSPREAIPHPSATKRRGFFIVGITFCYGITIRCNIPLDKFSRNIDKQLQNMCNHLLQRCVWPTTVL